MLYVYVNYDKYYIQKNHRDSKLHLNIKEQGEVRAHVFY